MIRLSELDEGVRMRYTKTMKTLQPLTAPYTVTERATKIYGGVLDIFDYNSSNDVVTPLKLARMQVRQCGKIGTMCVPGAGIGTYILAALLEGFSPKNITAVESDSAYYGLGSGIFSRFGVHYVHADFLTWCPEMKFDVIVGNPPFQEVTETGRKDQASNLWTKFWVKSLELAKDDGVVSLITPTSWLSPSANLKGIYKYEGKNRLWDVFDFYTSVAQVEGVEAYFKGVGSSFGIVQVDKSGSEGLSFKEGYSTDLGFLPKSGINEVLESVGGKSTLESHFFMSQDCGEGLRVSVPLTRKVTDESVEVLRGNEKPVKGSANPGLYLYVKVADDYQAERVKYTIVSNAAILNTHCRWSGFMNIKVCKMLNYEP
jgi:hypothetical protein